MKVAPNDDSMKMKTQKGGRLSGLLRSYWWEIVMCFIAYCDVLFHILELDARAAGNSSEFLILMSVCLVFQSCEVLMELLCFGPRSMVFNWTFRLHLSAVLFGFLEMVFGFSIARPIVEVGRIILLLGSIRGLGNASLIPKKAAVVQLCFGFMEVYLQMTAWAMVMVEVVYLPLKESEGTRHDGFECHDHCPTTVFSATLLIFELVVPGEWGVAGIIIRLYPGTWSVFIASMLCVLIHLINVLVSAFVVIYKSKGPEIKEKVVANILDDMDQGTGELTLDQLLEGAASFAAF